MGQCRPHRVQRGGLSTVARTYIGILSPTTMTADKIFVTQNKQLQHLNIPPEDDIRAKLGKWSVPQLRSWLGMRGVRSGDALKKDLVRIAYFTWKLDLPVNPDEVATQQEATLRLEELLTTGGTVLQSPTTVTDWTTDLRHLPTVTFGDIFNYLIKTPGMRTETLKAYKSLDSYNFAINGWVQELQINKPTANLVFVKAKVRPSQHSTAPYDAWVMVTQEGTVQAARCCCTAGLGEVCSHVGAILFKMMGAAVLGLNEPDTCTSIASQWNRAFCDKVNPELLENMSLRKPRIGKVWKRAAPSRKCSHSSSTSSSDGELWDIIAETCPTAVGLHILSPHTSSSDNVFCIDNVVCEVTVCESEPLVLPTLPATVLEIIEKSSPVCDTFDLFQVIKNSMSLEESQYVYGSTSGQSSDPLWHQVREHRITASKMGDVVSFMRSNRKTPSATLMDIIIGPRKSLDHVRAIRWGRENEEEARQEYAQKKRDHINLDIQKCGVSIPEGDAHLGATPDGYVTCSCCVDRVLEIKCPYTVVTRNLSLGEAVEGSYIDFLDSNGTLKASHKYFTQVQAQMAIFNVERCDFVVWTPDGTSVESIPFDVFYCDSIKENLDDFYVKYVIPCLLPDKELTVLPATPSPPTAPSLKRSIPQSQKSGGPKKKQRKKRT